MKDARDSFTVADRPYCLPLNMPGATLSRAGGKGLNLARLAQAGYPVPGAFIATTDGYDAFVTDAGLAGWMAAEVAAIDACNADALAALSGRLRARLNECSIPDGLAAQICAAYAEMGRPRVAVRSSATAEDLPDMSFAGQQETILNVLGEEALLNGCIRDYCISPWDRGRLARTPRS